MVVLCDRCQEESEYVRRVKSSNGSEYTWCVPCYQEVFGVKYEFSQAYYCHGCEKVHYVAAAPRCPCCESGLSVIVRCLGCDSEDFEFMGMVPEEAKQKLPANSREGLSSLVEAYGVGANAL